MRVLRTAMATLLVAGGLSSVSAHEPPGELLFMVEFPANHLPVIDGDLSDWDMIPKEIYEVSVENGWIVEANRGDAGNDLSDFNATSLWAWSEATNRIYSMAFVIDEHLDRDTDSPWRISWDDAWHFCYDADHSGGTLFEVEWRDLPVEERTQLMFVNGRTWEILVPPIEGNWAWAYEWNDPQWETDGAVLPFPEYVEIGWSRVGEDGGPGTYSYEAKFTPWEVFDYDGPGESTIVDLDAGNVIHVGSLYKDYDLDDGRYDGSYDFPRVHNVWRNADLMMDMELLPVDTSIFPDAVTGVEQDSWGRIKTHFLAE